MSAKNHLARAYVIALVVAALAAVRSAQASFDTSAPSLPLPHYDLSSASISFSGPAIPNGLVLRKLTTDLSSGQTAPSIPSPAGTYPLSSSVDIATEMSTDGGITWWPIQASAVPVSFTVGKQGGLTGTFNTELTSLSATFLTPVGRVSLRESPTLPSPGTETSADEGGGTYRIDSFFDVFAELSLDDGISWLPASAPATITGTPEPTSLAGVALLAMLTLRRRVRQG